MSDGSKEFYFLLQNYMAIYRGDTKVSGVGKGFRPENAGTIGQFLKKTDTGYAYDDIPEVTIDSVLSTTSENPVQNKVITNAIQSAGGASDHLEVKGLVGELYQLTDTMFLQNTPTLANSTVEQKVGDTADNTQIHIQRIASGTGSNELKLKVKKVGTPGDLSVQVMSGVQVTVTANVEAYWYGDSNNVLASGTVSASSITTSWQEITVTLDDEVGGTEGELLDIVLSIPTVSASNYVVIACDSTQWSEAFSFVSVNGSTRTRSKLMPYCVSDGFAQGLLCKVSLQEDRTNIRYNYSYIQYSYLKLSNGNTTNFSFKNGYIGKIRLVFGGFNTYYAAESAKFYVKIGGNDIYFNEEAVKALDKTIDIENNTGAEIRVNIMSNVGGNSDQRYFKNSSSCYAIFETWKESSFKKIKIYENKEIGGSAIGILFGMLPTGERRDGN